MRETFFGKGLITKFGKKVLSIILLVLGLSDYSIAGDFSFLHLSNASSAVSRAAEIGHVDGAYEVYDQWDTAYSSMPGYPYQNYLKLLTNPYEPLRDDYRPADSVAPIHLMLEVVGTIGDGTDNGLAFYIDDSTYEGWNNLHFNWKNIIAERYGKTGDINNPSDVIASYDVKDLIYNSSNPPWGFIDLPDLDSSVHGIYDNFVIRFYNNADLNRDQKADYKDLAIFADNYLRTGTIPSEPNASRDTSDLGSYADIDRSGVVNLRDFAKFSEQWCWRGKTLHGTYGGGDGIEADPYLIYNAEQMYSIGLHGGDWGKCFKLMNNIDMADYVVDGSSIIGWYGGIFDGNGHAISNYNINNSTISQGVGLFGIAHGAEIKNLGLINPNINGNCGYVGCFIGEAYECHIINSYAQGGWVSGGSPLGGLVGRNAGPNPVDGPKYDFDGTIEKCYSTVQVIGGGSYVGGITGLSIWGGSVVNTFLDSETSGRSGGLTTAEMQTESTYTGAGWDFTTPIWTIDEGNDYPRLWNE